jgi:hypothetical protein
MVARLGKQSARIRRPPECPRYLARRLRSAEISHCRPASLKIDWHPQDPVALHDVSRGRSMPRVAGKLSHPSFDGLPNDSQRSDVQSGNEMLRPRRRRAARTFASDRWSSVGRRPSRPSAAVNIAASSTPVARVPAMLTVLPMKLPDYPRASSRLRTVADFSSSDRAGVSHISKSPIRSSSVAISTSTISMNEQIPQRCRAVGVVSPTGDG